MKTTFVWDPQLNFHPEVQHPPPPPYEGYTAFSLFTRITMDKFC